MVCLGVTAVRAGDDQLSPQRLSLLLLKTISYDAHLKTRAGDSVVVGVVSRAGAGEKYCDDIVSSLTDQAKTTTVSGLPVKITSMEFRDVLALETKIQDSKVSVAFICPGIADRTAEIVQVTRKKSVISTTSERETTEKGASVGLIAKDSKPVILINVTAARAENAEFGVELLRLAEIIK